MMPDKVYKIAVLGAGPGGYVAAIRAAQRGFSVCLIEKDALGGECLNWGCIPTKAMLESAHIFARLKHARDLGIAAEKITFDFEQCQRRKTAVVEQMKKGILFLLKKHGVDIVYGRGKFLDKNSLDVDGRKVRFEYCVIATGAHSAELPDISFKEEEGIISHRGLLSLSDTPKSLLVIGGGVIGCEFADLFNCLGTEVTIVESAGQILLQEDAEAVRLLALDFKKRGISVHTSARVEAIRRGPSGCFDVTLSNGIKAKAEKILLSVGRVSNAAECGAAEVGIALDKGGIRVNEYMQTSCPNIYAIGDVVGKAFLAHVASREGIVAVEHINGNTFGINYAQVPRCIYTSLQLAGAGVTEKQALAEERKIKIGKSPFSASAKAVIGNQPQGFVKLIADSGNDVIIGGSVCGPEATEIIHEICLAIREKITVTELGHLIHAHPTLSESIMEAAEAANGTAIHVSS
ncbi:MAG: dihydrolipoyl dehydrogenase [Candidatus Omnitrophica bacterium]|nr:dihydrolipoyl dehydrogenase [Candidatus Omnitrophota bacterium]MBU4479489.1 dihydrolipoyl dehydrogenase [Candidatus Omnitrophota bacterium]MCG2703711.1 dihydrolipoyl dehydrogenase [Candidatus Omnitrophota bacterium]